MANETAVIRRETVDVVEERVRALQESRQIHLPEGYSAQNALKSAWLLLQTTLDKDKRPVLTVCSRASIANSLLDMVVQGLNPMKKQCYFIAYGGQLACQRSYFGTMAITKRVAAATEIYAQVVYGGDEFEYAIEKGSKRVLKHVQQIANVRPDNIVAAYCVIEWEDGRERTDIMTMDQILAAWSKSKMNPSAAGSTHKVFADQMVLKTVINRTCKAVINSSSDDHLFLSHFNRTTEAAEHEADDAAAMYANGEIIDVDGDDAQVAEEAMAEAAAAEEAAAVEQPMPKAEPARQPNRPEPARQPAQPKFEQAGVPY